MRARLEHAKGMGKDGAKDRERAPPIHDLVAVLIMLAVFGLVTGYTHPAIAFNLEARGFSAGLIGAQAACSGLGILVSAVLMPLLARRFGSWRLAVFGLSGTVVGVLGFGLTENLSLWFVLRFLLGAAVSMLFVVSEVWINELTPDRWRGRVIGIYTATNAGTFACGPLLVPVVGYSGLESFGVMAAAVALLGLALFRLRTVARPLEAVPFRVSLRVVAIIPLPLLAVVAFGYFDGVTLALWVPYAFAQGLDEAAAALSLSAVIMGNVLLQFPIGWLADRVDRRRLFFLLAVATCAGAALLPLVDLASTWGLLCLLVWGAAAFGLYTLSLILIGQRLSGMRLMAATAAFAVAWGLGGLIGPWITGLLMDGFGPQMLAVALAGIYGLLTLAALTIAPILAQNRSRFEQARAP